MKENTVAFKNGLAKTNRKVIDNLKKNVVVFKNRLAKINGKVIAVKSDSGKIYFAKDLRRLEFEQVDEPDGKKVLQLVDRG